MPDVQEVNPETKFLLSDIPDALRRLRKQNALTLAQLSERCRLSVSYLSDIERGRTKPTLDTLHGIISSYGQDVFISFESSEKIFEMFGFLETQVLYALERRDYGKALLFISQLMGACCEDADHATQH